jgi:hypothetical protein bfra3_16653
MIMNRKGIIILLLSLLVSSATFAQGRKMLRINEVMVQNDSNYVDGYGLRHAWIELYNSSFANMEISSIYLTNDSTMPTKYPVPRGDVQTEIHPRQHVLFWADGEPNKGTFHLNFTLTPGVDNWIGVYDADGKTLIDSVVVPAELPANQTYARKADGEGVGVSAWEIRDGGNEKYITPSGNNIIVDVNVKKEKFITHDPVGLAMTIMAMAVVFSALIALSLAFFLIGKFGERIAKRNKLKAHGVKPSDSSVADIPLKGDSGEEIAAVCMALYEHLNAHDKEDTVLTINKVKRAYSPWSSKIYTLREVPKR